MNEGKMITIDKIIKHNQIINNNLKSQVYNDAIMLFKALKKNTENINPRVSRTSNKEIILLSKCNISHQDEWII